MLALSLLISAAAGVNAILGGEVSQVVFPDGSYICADNCMYRDVYFSQRGYYCPSKEVVTLETPIFNIDGLEFDCADAPKLPDYTPRQRVNGEEPYKCKQKPNHGQDSGCKANRLLGEFKKGKTLQWSEVERSLKSAISEDGQNTPAKNDDLWVWH